MVARLSPLLLLLPLLALPARGAEEPARLRNQGVALVGAGRFAEGLELLEKAAPALPRDARLQLYRAIALVKLGRSQEGLAAYDRALAINPSNPRAWLLKGMALDLAERHQEAATTYRKGLVNAPRSGDLHHELGMTLLLLDRTGEALPHLTRATEITPGASSLWLDLGYARKLAGDLPGAEKALRRGLAMDPGAHHARAWLADVLLGQGHPAQAIPLYRQALDSGQAPASAPFHLALALIQNGDLPGAEKLLAALVKKYPVPRHQAALADLRLRQGRPQEAVPLLQAAVAQKPGYRAAWGLLARAFRALGRKSDAERAAGHSRP